MCVCLRRLLKDSPHFFFGAGTSQGYSFPKDLVDIERGGFEGTYKRNDNSKPRN